MDGSRGDEEENAAHRQGEQHQRRNEQHQIQCLTLPCPYPDNQQNSRGKPQKPMKNSGCLRRSQGIGSACKNGKEGAVGKQGVGRQRQRGEGHAIRGVARHFLVGQTKSQLGNPIVQPQGKNQEENIAAAIPEHGLSVFALQKPADDHNHQQSGAQPNKGLINAQSEHQAAKSGQMIPPFLPGHKPSGQHRQQKGQTVAAAHEHIAESARERRKGDYQSRRQNLRPGAFQRQQAHQNAHGHRQKENGENAVNPGHGHIGKQVVHKAQPPATQHHAAALGEQGIGLVVVHKLIGKGKAVSQKAENQCGAQGYPVFLGLFGKPEKEPLKEQGIGFCHEGTLLSFAPL